MCGASVTFPLASCSQVPPSPTGIALQGTREQTCVWMEQVKAAPPLFKLKSFS